jgi:hypothetical protein
VEYCVFDVVISVDNLAVFAAFAALFIMKAAVFDINFLFLVAIIPCFVISAIFMIGKDVGDDVLIFVAVDFHFGKICVGIADCFIIVDVLLVFILVISFATKVGFALFNISVLDIVSATFVAVFVAAVVLTVFTCATNVVFVVGGDGDVADPSIVGAVDERADCVVVFVAFFSMIEYAFAVVDTVESRVDGTFRMDADENGNCCSVNIFIGLIILLLIFLVRISL